MLDVAWDLVRTPFFAFLLVLLIAGVAIIWQEERRYTKARRQERGHG